MRELKFRAWHKQKKKMYQVGTFSNVHKCVNCCELSDNPPYCRWTFVFEDIKLMQYIGHNDINNKEIFEDDLVKDENGAIYRVVYNEQDGQYVYLYVHEQDIIGAWHDVEVIGNVWENGELVGRKMNKYQEAIKDLKNDCWIGAWSDEE